MRFSLYLLTSWRNSAGGTASEEQSEGNKVRETESEEQIQGKREGTQLEELVGSAVILCLNTVQSVDLMHLSSVLVASACISALFLVSSFPRLIFIQYPSCLMSPAQIVSQRSDRSGFVSTVRPFRPCLKFQLMFRPQAMPYD